MAMQGGGVLKFRFSLEETKVRITFGQLLDAYLLSYATHSCKTNFKFMFIKNIRFWSKLSGCISVAFVKLYVMKPRNCGSFCSDLAQVKYIVSNRI